MPMEYMNEEARRRATGDNAAPCSSGGYADGPLHLARSFDDVVDEILDMLHENVQFYDRLGEEANISVMHEIKPWIEQALINCEEASR